ncbi:tyrosine kinase domain protein [Rhizoctonia solani AG-3 Rhs1AP]|nr:tyrosine kinase domain protein [Rhizoctonia solani AG-3 Rhs1AP]KEP46168.1 tyrosine kinase domain protein [Rhizoctonia solani 123E]
MYTHKVLQWASLRHENIIRVYSHTQSLNLHVDFCPNGTVRDAFQTPGGRMKDKWDIISETLAGLKYLHDHNPPIIHGNINAGKLFLDSNYKTKIGEFGLAALCYQISPFVPSISFDGFSRWMSKELLAIDPITKSSLSPTTQSDIWALACTILEIFTEKFPFARYNLDFQIMTAILSGELPGFRDELASGHNFNMVWEVLEGCWSGDPLLRPKIDSIILRFQAAGFLNHTPLYAPTGLPLSPPSPLLFDTPLVPVTASTTHPYYDKLALLVQERPEHRGSDMQAGPDPKHNYSPGYLDETEAVTSISQEYLVPVTPGPSKLTEVSDSSDEVEMWMDLGSTTPTIDEIKAFTTKFRREAPGKGAQVIICRHCPSDDERRRITTDLRPWNLTRHLLIDFGIKNFYCNECNPPRGFTFKDQRDRHVAKRHRAGSN